MALSPHFPTDPYAILLPEVRWYPGDDVDPAERANLLPPLVQRIREEVKAWRERRYEGASDTTRALLYHWFETEHLLPAADGTVRRFQYYFAQREAAESAIWLYEVAQARDPYSLIRYDSSGLVSRGMFDEDWPRYVLKLATGAGKTKVISLLIAWCYFHRSYEADSDLSTNFLLVAPNIIVLDRLRQDFDGLRIFYDDPVLPPNGHEGRNWHDDFQMTLHVQDDIGIVSETGNLFLTNIHRVFRHESEPAFDDADSTEYFLGPRPVTKTTDSRTDLGVIIRQVPDLVVLNDEAHHIHDPDMAWFRSIAEISGELRLRSSKLSAQFDFTATPRRENGAVFVQVVSDYPLVEAIRQGVVKTPVLPDEASRAKLVERKSSKFAEQYADYLRLGYLEWKKVYDELEPAGKKSVLFIMTDDTRNCDEVGEWLERHYPDLAGAVLVIHTKRNGEISEAASGKATGELETLRRQSREIDGWESPYKVIVSVMVLREGWDVQNVVSIVGLRPFKSKSQILPEQTLGRGLRRMFRGRPVQERVSVIGTEAFMDFVESIKVEGVELEYAPMGPRTAPQSPLVVEVDREDKAKDIDKLEIALPVLAPRLVREYKNLDAIDVRRLPAPALPVKRFSEEQQREIVFKDIDTEQRTHTTILDGGGEVSPQHVVGYFARTIMRDLRLVGGFDVLYGKVKGYIEARVFTRPVTLDDPNVVRNLSEPEAAAAVLDTFKRAVNELTVQDRGTTEVRDYIKMSRTRPFLVREQPVLYAKKSLFNKVVGDNDFEREFAGFLEACPEVVSFVKNSQSTAFRIEYRTHDGTIANYYPDFVARTDSGEVWVVETKGREDLEDPEKWSRLVQWCADASARDQSARYRPMFVRQERFEEHRPRTLGQAATLFDTA